MNNDQSFERERAAKLGIKLNLRLNKKARIRKTWGQINRNKCNCCGRSCNCV